MIQNLKESTQNAPTKQAKITTLLTKDFRGEILKDFTKTDTKKPEHLNHFIYTKFPNATEKTKATRLTYKQTDITITEFADYTLQDDTLRVF